MLVEITKEDLLSLLGDIAIPYDMQLEAFHSKLGNWYSDGLRGGSSFEFHKASKEEDLLKFYNYVRSKNERT